VTGTEIPVSFCGLHLCIKKKCTLTDGAGSLKDEHVDKQRLRAKPTALQGIPAMNLRLAQPCRRHRCATLLHATLLPHLRPLAQRIPSRAGVASHGLVVVEPTTL